MLFLSFDCSIFFLTIPLFIKPLRLWPTWEYFINLILLKCHPHFYPISSTLLLKSFICSSLSWLGIAIRSGKSQGIWIYILLKIVKFLINEACWSFIIYGWGPLNCTRSSSLLLFVRGLQCHLFSGFWGEIMIFQRILSRGKSIFKMPGKKEFWRRIWIFWFLPGRKSDLWQFTAFLCISDIENQHFLQPCWNIAQI